MLSRCQFKPEGVSFLPSSLTKQSRQGKPFSDTFFTKGYANPPWCLVGRVLSQARRQQAQLILVAPVWKGQLWYPVLLGMLWDFPRQLPRTVDLFQQTSNAVQMDLVPQLAVWPISGISSEVEVFQRQLRSSSLHPGGTKHLNHTTHTSRSCPLLAECICCLCQWVWPNGGVG